MLLYYIPTFWENFHKEFLIQWENFHTKLTICLNLWEYFPKEFLMKGMMKNRKLYLLIRNR